jgi:hypothetical protein
MTASRRIAHANIQDASQRIGCGKRRRLITCRGIDRGRAFGLAAGMRGEEKKSIDQLIIEEVVKGNAQKIVAYPVVSDLVRPD